MMFASVAAAQIQGPAPFDVIPRPSRRTTARPGKTLITPPNNVPDGFVLVDAVRQAREGPWYRLRESARVETSSLVLKADEIDYNGDTGYAEARGHVYLQHFDGGEELWADRAEYNVDAEGGKFFVVQGTAPVRVEARPHVLTSTNPFHFEGEWAEKKGDKYILHNGFITNCRMPRPWWVIRGPLFDIIPRDRALAYRSVFWLRGKFPVFYTPFFYKSLKRLPRKSGILAPTFGNSSTRGKMFGGGYYWAINRSYDATYYGRYFTQRGLLHQGDFRGKPREGTDYNATIYGIRGDSADPKKPGGLLFSLQARSELGHGWYARADVNYLSSLRFRQDFTESYNEAIGSEVHSSGFLAKDWSSYGLAVLIQRNENFQSNQPDDTIVIRKMPEVNFVSRDRQVWRNVPVWISWESSAGLLRRTQLAFQTRQVLERVDIYPRVMTALRWNGFSFLPSFAVRETHYGESRRGDDVFGQNIRRSAREFSTVISAPSLERIYGKRFKHVIEARASYLYVTGVNNFDRLVRFDDMETYSNTNEVEASLVNRLFAKRNGAVEEIFTWQLSQKFYFDPTFGGAIVPGQRNILLTGLELTPYTFLDGERHYSPVVSSVRVSPKPGIGVRWRSDYDPLRGSIVNNSMGADVRFSKYYFALSHNTVRGVPLLSPNTHQIEGRFLVGGENRRGWNAGVSGNYDIRRGVFLFGNAEVTYNTDCCGFSVQYYRRGWLRDVNTGATQADNGFRFSFAVANIGSFGNLKKQERMF